MTITKERSLRIRLINPTIILMTLLAIFYGQKIKDGVLIGLKMCAENLLPTLFPFMILSDLWTDCFQWKKNGRLAKLFERVFGISSYGLTPFILGNLCGFPIGIKSANSLYEKGVISKSELERIIGFSNNPSLAFVIFGIGAGMINNIYTGVKVYLVVILSTIITGLIYRNKTHISKNTRIILGQNYSFTSSIRSSAVGCVYVCGYVSFFSGVISLLSTWIHSQGGLALTSSFFEIGSASRIIIFSSEFPVKFRYAILGFALGFSGISVHMQSFALMPKDVLKTSYIKMKLTEGLICFLVLFVLM